MINKKCLDYGATGSIIRELYEYGRKRKQEIGEENVYDFSLGNPSVSTPKAINDALIRLVASNPDGVHRYTSAKGDYGVRKTIAERLNASYGCKVSGHDLYLVCGAAAGLTSTIRALLANPEEEAIVIAPFFPEYRTFIEASNGKMVISMADEKMMPDILDLEKKINKNTSILITDSPNNPTGAVYPESIIKEITILLRKKEEEYGHPIYWISDEPYRELIYNEEPYPFITNYYNNAIVIYSYSKSLSLPGERFGYVLVSEKATNHKEVLAAIRGAGRLLGFVNAPSLFQYVIGEAGDALSDIASYKRNRDALISILSSIGFEFIEPSGAFYLFMKCLEKDALAFAERAKKFDLILVPSDSFGVKGYVRLAYCVSLETILDSKEAFQKLYDSYQ